MQLATEVNELPSRRPLLASGLPDTHGRMFEARQGIAGEVYRLCLNRVKWPRSRPEVKLGDGDQVQLLGLAQSFFAEQCRKERYFSVGLAHSSTMQFFICVFLLAQGKNKSCMHKGAVLES